MPPKLPETASVPVVAVLLETFPEFRVKTRFVLE
jgi:hypothetical protein